MSEIELSMVGLAGVLITLVIRFRAIDPSQKQNPSSSVVPPFEILRDRDVSDRNDARTFAEYRTIFADSQRQWATGAISTDAARAASKNTTLDFVLNAEARRASHAEKAPVTLVIVKDTGSEFIVKRVAPPSFGNGIRPGLTCHPDNSLATLAERYAPSHFDVEFPACGERYHLVALTDQPLSPTAIGIVQDAASRYQSYYTYYRMAGLATPPLLPPPASSDA